MARAYCTPDDVKNYLPPNMIVEGSTTVVDYMNPESSNVKAADVDFYIQQASQMVDGYLRTIYYVPFKKINQGGTKDFPYPIPMITALLTAQKLYERFLQGSDKAHSEANKDREEEAMSLIISIQNGELTLDGQRMRGSRYVRQGLYNIPRNPAEGGRSKGKG